MAFTSYIHGANVTSPRTLYREGHAPLEPPPALRGRTPNGAPGVAGAPPITTQSEENQKIVDAIMRVKQYEADKKATYQSKADAAWEAWNNIHNLDGKAGWQEQSRIPKAWVECERMVANFMNFITVVPDWFDIDSVLPSQELAINLVKNKMKYDLEDDRIGFWPLVEDAFREMMLTGNADTFIGFERGRIPIMEAEPKPEEIDDGAEDADPKKLGLDFSLFGKGLNQVGLDMGVLSTGTDPDTGERVLLPSPDTPRPRLERIPFERCYRDSSGLKRYVIWETYANVGDFRHLAEQCGYDPDAVERAIAAANTPTASSLGNISRDKAQGNKPASGTGDPDLEYAITLTHIQGTLYDMNNKGEILFRNKYAVVANGELMLPEPVESPFWDGELPIIHSRIARNPQSVYGRSIIAENVEIYDLQISLIHQLADALQRELDPAYEFDRSTMPSEDPRRKPLGPGVVYETIKSGTNQPSITKIPAGSFDGNVANAYQMLNIALESLTSATQEAGTGARTRNRMTGVEFAAREQQASGLSAHFFNNIDKEFLTPLLRLLFLRSLQFTPDRQWKLWVLANRDRIVPKTGDEAVKKKWNEELEECANWTARERYKNLGAYFRFKVKIFGNALQRQMLMERVTGLLNIVRQSPEMLAKMNIQYILTRLVETMGWDPEEAINAESNYMPEVNADQILRPPAPPAMSQPIPTPNLYGDAGSAVGIGIPPGTGPTEAPTMTPGM